MDARTSTWQRLLVLAAIVGSVLVFNSRGQDAFGLPKTAVATAAVVGLVAVAVVRLWALRRVELPSHPGMLLALGWVLAAMAVATITSPVPVLSFVGQPGRATGLLLYLVCGALFLFTVRRFPPALAHYVAIGFLVVGLIVTGYAALQWMGADPVGWQHEFNPIVATHGNPNFSAAFLGMVVPVSLWGAVSARWSAGVRTGCAVLSGAAFLLAVATGSLQGPMVAVGGAAVIVLAWMLNQTGLRRRIGVPVFLGTGAVALALVVIGFAGAGPLSALNAKETFEIRRWYWAAAVDMAADHPATGVGMDLYADHYRRYRVPETSRWGIGLIADAPHNVPLGMFAMGGLPLGLGYLAFVAFVGWAVVRGLRRLDGEERLLVGGLAGAWLAYQAQSAVSIDMPGLAVSHWVLAGAVVSLGIQPTTRMLSFGGHPVPDGSSKRARKQRLTPELWPPVAIAGILVAAGIWLVSLPVRANAAAGLAQNLVAEERYDAAQPHAERAVALAPWDYSKWSERGRLYSEWGQSEEAVRSYEAALRRNPLSFVDLVNAARRSVQLGRFGEAQSYYERALTLDPLAGELYYEAAQHWLNIGQLDQGIDFLVTATRLQPDQAQYWYLLAQAYAADGRIEQAREAAAAALDLNPDDLEMQVFLNGLDDAAGAT